MTALSAVTNNSIRSRAPTDSHSYSVTQTALFTPHRKMPSFLSPTHHKSHLGGHLKRQLPKHTHLSGRITLARLFFTEWWRSSSSLERDGKTGRSSSYMTGELSDRERARKVDCTGSGESIRLCAELDSRVEREKERVWVMDWLMKQTMGWPLRGACARL